MRCIGGCGIQFDDGMKECPACHLPVLAQHAARKAWQKATAVINTNNLDDWEKKRKEFNLYIAYLLMEKYHVDGEDDELRKAM